MKRELTIVATALFFAWSVMAAESLYCVIDLSGGANAEMYPVTYMNAAPVSGWTDEYKTTKLVLRRIDAKTATLTKAFYIGVFEVTQKQWELVMGANPCSSTIYGKGDTYPVHLVSYNKIRGSSAGNGWPDSLAVDATSFVGRLQVRTGRDFDLPTEAQWEYACRAGTTTTYYWGNSMDGGYAWYKNNAPSVAQPVVNGSSAQPVGKKKPNAWGLYDMSGNVWEWCLDWYGASSDSKRVRRGGCSASEASGCSSTVRVGASPSEVISNGLVGFRLATLPVSDGTINVNYVGGNPDDIYDGEIVRAEASSGRARVDTTFVDGEDVAEAKIIGYSPLFKGTCQVEVDEAKIVSSAVSGSIVWQPLTIGAHTLKHISGAYLWTQTVNVTKLAFQLPSEPNPPMEESPDIKIRQSAHSFAATGGTYAIPTAGVDGYTGSYTVSVSDDWITINTVEANWMAGRSVVYAVAPNDGAEARVGYVYVSGHVHTITQAGIGSELSASSAGFGKAGGKGRFTVFADADIGWTARPDANWISVNPISGSGTGEVVFVVAPLHEAACRSATITVAGSSFTVNQIGRCVAIDRSEALVGFAADTLDFTVTTLEAATDWEVESDVDWIVVEGATNRQGGDTLTLAIEENPSYRSRVGMIWVDAESITVFQEGRSASALDFSIDPVETTVSEAGTEGLVEIRATPDMPWSAKSESEWISVVPTSARGAGNGSASYVVLPNPAISERRGTITVTPDDASGLETKTLLIVQPAAKVVLSAESHEFMANGEVFEVGVSVRDDVEWGVSNETDWVVVEGAKIRSGAGNVRVRVEENLTVVARETAIVIAGQEFRIVQSGRTVEVSPVVKGVPVGGDFGEINVVADEDVIWNAMPSELWISIWGDDDCDYDAVGNVVDVGPGKVNYYVDECDTAQLPRNGWIQVGDKRVNIIQTRDGAFVSVVDDPMAIVACDAGKGFVVRPSAGKTSVEISIPDGMEAEKVTVEVSANVERIIPHGAQIRVVNGAADITGFLDVPLADEDGVIDLTKTMVKEEIVKEVMDPAKGAVIRMDAASPFLTTPNTRKGLFYQLREGETLDGMKNGDSTIGDGKPWSPEITVKGGNSAFYSIGVGKGK